MYMAAMLAVFSSKGQTNTTSSETLFDGKTLTGWKVVGGQATFEVKNGEIIGTTVANTGNSFLVTEKEYADFVFEVDIKIEDTANNSGPLL